MSLQPDSPVLPDYSHERALLRAAGGPVCGIDEAGRGPWAGPVVAAAVMLDPDRLPEGLNDSKKLTSERREQLFDDIAAVAVIGVGIAEVDRIDSINILQATFWAMAQAVDRLAEPPVAALVDGNQVPRLPCRGQCVIGGDGRSLSIAAASIIAKVTRDRIMRQLAASHPGYGWETNMGYGTAEHSAALARLGPTVHHRRSFAPVREIYERLAI